MNAYRPQNPITWSRVDDTATHHFTCGYCGSSIASQKAFSGEARNTPHGAKPVRIYVCHACTRPTFIDDDGKQFPGAVHGNMVNNVSDAAVSALYDETRRCIAANAPTSAVLACRKLLMHVAVEKGAKEDETFKYYTQYLLDNHLVPLNAKDWVSRIKDKGNEANHEIRLMTIDEAKDIIRFCEMLLKLVYELPAMAQP